MRVIKTLILSALCLSLLAACADPNSSPGQNTTTGAVTGGIIGAIVGAALPGDNKKLKIAVGAVAGTVIGAGIGQNLDRQAAELRGNISNPNVSVVNTGKELIVTMPESILFAFDSAAVSPNLTNDLYAVANNLRRYPDSVIRVLGHTDNVGVAAYNQDLSQRRANAVASILINAGVPGSRISAIGVGENQPIASNLTAAGQAQNRRVEIRIVPTN